MAISKVAVLVSALVVCSLAAQDVYSWTPIDYKTIPAAQPGDRVELYYLVAPLLKASYGDWLSYLGLYHGALGFVNRNNNVSFTCNFDANDFFRSNLFPEIVEKDGEKDLKWDNTGALYLYDGIWTEYFDAGNNLIATLDGSQYNDLMSTYISKVNSTHGFYNMVNVKERSTGNLYVDGWDCFDFAWATFDELTRRNIKLSDDVLKRNSINLWSSTFEKIEYNATTRGEIIEFYEITQAAFGEMSIWEIVTEAWRLVRGKWFIRVDETYYKLNLEFPPFSIHLDHVTAGAHVSSTKDINLVKGLALMPPKMI